MESVKRYKHMLWRKLSCFPKTKQTLLASLQPSLDRFLEDNPAPDYDSLTKAFGSPEEMAKLLMADISPEEEKKYRRFSRAVQIAADIGLVLLVLFTLYVLLNPLTIRIVDAVQKDSYTIWPG